MKIAPLYLHMSKEAWFAQKAYGTEQHFLTPQNKT